MLPLASLPANARFCKVLVPKALYVVSTREFSKITRYTRAYGLSQVLPGTGNVAGIGHPKADGD